MTSLQKWLAFNLRYFGSPPWDTGITPPEVEDYIKNHPPGRALDLGCGSGTNLITFGKAGWKAVGIDFAFRAVIRAQRRIRMAKLRGVEAHVGDVTQLKKWKPPFDLVLDIGCYHSLPAKQRDAYLQNLKRLLRKGGQWLIYSHLRREAGVGIGLDEEEIRQITRYLWLVQRTDSYDQGAKQPATWMLLQKD